jgi:hypothetical protein
LVPRTKRAREAVQRTGLLRGGVDQLLRTAGLICDIAKPSQQRRHRRINGGLDGVAIKAERRSNAPDHVWRQELHDKCDKIDGHGSISC